MESVSQVQEIVPAQTEPMVQRNQRSLLRSQRSQIGHMIMLLNNRKNQKRQVNIAILNLQNNSNQTNILRRNRIRNHQIIINRRQSRTRSHQITINQTRNQLVIINRIKSPTRSHQITINLIRNQVITINPKNQLRNQIKSPISTVNQTRNHRTITMKKITIRTLNRLSPQNAQNVHNAPTRMV